MAFRKGSRRGFRSFKGRRVPWKRLPRNVARTRKQWVTLYNDGGTCTYNCLPVVDCNDLPFNIELISNTALHQFFDDNVTVEALRGEIWMRPWLNTADRCDSADWLLWIQSLERSMHHLRLGLVKERVTTADITAGNPEGSIHDPLSSFDWSEQRWLKEWRHTWPAPGRDAFQTTVGSGALVGVCSNVERPSYTVPAAVTGDQPLYIVPDISTECTAFVTDPEGEECYYGHNGLRAKSQPWWKMNMSFRKKIRMRESDNLSIWGNMSYIDPDFIGPTGTCSADVLPGCGPQSGLDIPCALQTFSNVKILLSYGG